MRAWMGGRTYVMDDRPAALHFHCIFCMLCDWYDLALTTSASMLSVYAFLMIVVLFVVTGCGTIVAAGCWRPKKWTERAFRGGSLNGNGDSPAGSPRRPRASTLLALQLVHVGAA